MTKMHNNMADGDGPNTRLYGRPIKCLDPNTEELIAEGILTEVSVPFGWKIDDTWYEVGESYNCNINKRRIIIWGWKS